MEPEPEDGEEVMEDPPSRDSPMNMMSTLICSHCRKVRSLAKKVLGSTRVRTRALALHSRMDEAPCSGPDFFDRAGDGRGALPRWQLEMMGDRR